MFSFGSDKPLIIDVISELLRIKTCKIDTIGKLFNLKSEKDDKKDK